jgi:hypothetical protein
MVSTLSDLRPYTKAMCEGDLLEPQTPNTLTGREREQEPHVGASPGPYSPELVEEGISEGGIQDPA